MGMRSNQAPTAQTRLTCACFRRILPNILGKMNDHEIARELAREAGETLRRIQRDSRPDDHGTRALKDRGDQAAQDVLAAGLARWRPQDAVLSEEAQDDRVRLASERVWIIDPLDGTREFSEGREDWAVHVALWQRGALAAGAVALPALDTVLTTDREPAIWQTPERIRLAVSRSRPTELVLGLAEDLNAEVVPMGSAGYKASAVVRGEVDAYVHTGGQFEWDSAAPVAVAAAAGLFTARVDGSPLRYNRPDPYLPDVVVCNPLIADEVLARVGVRLEEETR